MKRIVTAGVAALGLTLIVPQVAHSAETHHFVPTYTMAQVAQHKTATDCWSAVNGGVYNLTTWLPLHTFGPFTVAAICGVDSSAIFNSFARPSSSGGGEHSSSGRHDGGEDRAKVSSNRIGVKQAAIIRSDGDHGRRNGRNPALRSIRRYIIGILVTANPTPLPVPVPTVTPTPTPTPRPTVTPTPTPTPTATPTPTPTPTPTVTPLPTFTLAQVAAHNTIADCWTAISGSVYNLSDWASTHVGGPGVLLTNICGKDGTAAFSVHPNVSPSPTTILTPARKVGTLV